MADSARHRSIATPRARRKTARGWWAALALALGFVAWDTAENVLHYTRTSARYGIAVHAPRTDAASLTGFADGRRTMVYPSRWVDAQHWIVQTQQMLATGEARLRRVDDDNAPFGRAVHWGSPFRWWLASCAIVAHALTGEPVSRTAEWAVIFANPVLLALLLLTLVPWVARRFGGVPAGFLALAMIGTSPFYVLFAPDNMDHHGLIQACIMISLTGILSAAGGWTRDETKTPPTAWQWLPDAARARHGFTLSGIAGGFGMWVSAAGMIPVFIGIGIGGLGSAWLGRQAPGYARYVPDLWRRWGLVGGATALICYLAEYFPAHLGWRLEVNHPLYALAWVGAGEALAQLTSWLRGDSGVRGPISWWRLALGLGVAAVPAIVIAVAGERVFVVSDPFLWALSHDYTPEFQGLLTAVQRTVFDLATIASGPPMLLALGVGAWFVRRRTPALSRAIVAVPWAATALFWLMAFKELRWWTVGYGFLFGVVVLGLAMLTRAELPGRRRLAGWVLGVLFLAPGVIDAVQTLAHRDTSRPDDVYSLVERDLAHALRQRVGGGPLVVLAAPGTTSRLIYFGSAKGLGTPYWENIDGMKRAAAIFAAKSADEARTLVQAAGITHLVVLSWDDFTEPYVRLARGIAPNDPITESAFGLELLRAPVPPPWLRRIPDHLPDLPLLQKEAVAIFEVTERTRPEEVLVRTVRERLYRGQLAAAQELLPQLESQSPALAVQVALARLYFAARHTAGFNAAMGQIDQLLGQLATLEPEDRVDLIGVLALGRRATDARIQLDAALRGFDAAALRGLTPGSLKSLLGLSRQLDVAWPDPRLQALADELLPPDGRL